MHLCATLKTPAGHSGDFVPMHLALDVHGVQLSVVVLGDDLHDILLLEGILIRSLHRTHTLDGDGGAHLQRTQAAKKRKKNGAPINTSVRRGPRAFQTERER